MSTVSAEPPTRAPPRSRRVGTFRRLAALFVLSGCTLSLPDPTITAISPARGWTGESTAVEIRGEHFLPAVSVGALDPVGSEFEAWLLCNPEVRLEGVQLVDYQTLDAQVPAGVEPALNTEPPLLSQADLDTLGRTAAGSRAFALIQTDEQLAAAFASCGKITSAVVHRDANGKSKRHGFCNFELPEAALKCIEQFNDSETLSTAGDRIQVLQHLKRSEYHRQRTFTAKIINSDLI